MFPGRRGENLRLGLVLLLLVFAAPGWAAQMDVRGTPNGSWIFIRGPLLADDGARFKRLLATTADAAVVALESDGGRLIAGLAIGTAIRERQLTTIVQDFARCASSCALAWLGGTRRYMAASARIGFHAAYLVGADRSVSESGVGNALLGAYLNRLGLSDRAVVHITAASPTQITWLTLRDARALDIEVLPTATAATANPIVATPRAATTNAATQAGLERIAQQFVLNHFEQAAQSPAVAMAYFETAYADEVTINDSPQPRPRILAQRRRMAEHWPEQTYTVRPDSLAVQCQRMTVTCDVGGVMDWAWSSWGRGARASGSARFWFKLAIENDATLIRAEALSIISRENSGPQ